MSKKNIGAQFGLINGCVAIIFTLVLYLNGVKAFLSMLTWIGPALAITICVLGGLQQRKLQGGYIEFGEALKVTFMILVLGALLRTTFEYVLFNFIDVPFRDALSQATAEEAERTLEKWGMPQDRIDKQMDAMLNNNLYSAGQLFLGFAIRCIGLFVIALIVSAIIKRKRPPFDNSFNQ